MSCYYNFYIFFFFLLFSSNATLTLISEILNFSSEEENIFSLPFVARNKLNFLFFDLINFLISEDFFILFELKRDWSEVACLS